MDNGSTEAKPYPPDLTFRRAERSDVPAIVALLSDDVLGASRELSGGTGLEAYLRGFDEITADPNQFLCVATDDDEVVGTMQLTFIPGLSRAGAKRGPTAVRSGLDGSVAHTAPGVSVRRCSLGR